MTVLFFTLAAWLLFGFLAIGPAAFIFYSTRRDARKTWPTKIDSNYKPKISIIVPTYNESSIILFKLINLSHLNYPKHLNEIIVVDSSSSDNTVEIVKQFSEKQLQTNIKILVEQERKGKAHALNYSLKHCKGDVIVISDADCFWSADILEKALPFLADPEVGAISGPKILLNSNQTWITRLEENYLKSANVSRLGESKAGSTLFFEGGFSAFKKEAFDRFDPYGTGSDDCGTVLQVIEKNFRAMLVPDAKFFSAFPKSFRGKITIKLRRTNQLIRVFSKYLDLLIKRKINTARKVIIPNTFLYLFSPIAFVLFFLSTLVLLSTFPFLLVASVFLLIPSLRFYFFEILESNLLLFISIFVVLTGRKFSVWSQPRDRAMFTKDMLSQFNLI